jgi:aspartate kinase
MNRHEVWKFGGTSLDTVEKRARIGQRVAAERGKELVIVVSAAAGVTDQLLRTVTSMANVTQDAIDAYVATGEMQSAALVAAAIQAAGRRAEVVLPTSLLYCNDRFGDADVMEVDPAPVLERMRRGVVSVVPGFFGSSPDGRIALLGRGGTDYTAVLLGAALRCPVVLLKNDTDGIYTADPNRNPDARRYDRLSHAEALALSCGGAKVLNGKAAATALNENVPLVVRSTFGAGPGTLIVSETVPAADSLSGPAAPEGLPLAV